MPTRGTRDTNAGLEYERDAGQHKKGQSLLSAWQASSFEVICLFIEENRMDINYIQDS